nr:MAG TPA: hypothetical protein [Caudoviricetes sp.]
MSDPFSRLVMSVMRSATVARSHAYQVRVYSPPWMAGRVMGRGPYWRVSSMRPLMMSGYEPVMVRARPLDGCCSSTRIGPSRQVSLSPRGRTRRFDRRVRPPPQSRERLRVSAFHVYEVRGPAWRIRSSRWMARMTFQQRSSSHRSCRAAVFE